VALSNYSDGEVDYLKVVLGNSVKVWDQWSEKRGYGLQPNLGAGFFQKPEKQLSASPKMLFGV
jgi:hypothetical protein